MSALSRRTSFTALLSWACCAGAMGQGYLPLVGPPPVRFDLPLPPTVAEPIVLPPLPIIEPRPSPDPADSAAPGLSRPLPGSAAEPQPSGESPATTTNLARVDLLSVPIWPLYLDSSAAAINAGSGLPMIGSQSFLKYFSGQPGTNSTGVSIFAPLGFVPPLPVLPPSSSAVFEVVPNSKP